MVPGQGGVKLVRVVAPFFVAGFETSGGEIRRAAPIIRYMEGWSDREARLYIRRRGWKASVISFGDDDAQ